MPLEGKGVFQMNRDQFENELAAISAAAEEISSEIGQLEATVTTAAAAKDQAKQDYQQALDAGDEKGMKNALAAIRRANEERGTATTALRSADIRQRIQALHDREQVLAHEIGPMREKAEAAKRAACSALEEVEVCRSRVSSAFSRIVAADDRLTAALDDITGPVLPPRRDDAPVVRSVVNG
jgi:chromosome segregation ATPase